VKQRLSRRCLAVASLLLICAVNSSFTQEVTPGKIVGLRKANDPQLSPDGRTVLIGIDEMPDSTGTEELSTLWSIATLPSSTPQPLRATGDGDHGVQWQPNSNTFAFLSSRAHDAPGLDGTTQVYVAGLGDAAARRITSSRTGVDKFVWSSDGTRIAFVAPDTAIPAKRFPGSDAIVSGSVPVKRGWVVDVANGSTCQLEGNSLDIQEIAWSPNGREIAAIAAAAPRSSLALVVLDATTGRIARTLAEKVSSVTRVLRWSPDGSWITFFQNTPRERAFWLAAAPAAGGSAVALLKDYPGTVMQIAWRREQDQLVMIMLRGTQSFVMQLDVRTGEAKELARINTSQASWGLSSNGDAIAYLAETPSSPPDVWLLGEGGTPAQLTNLNPAVAAWQLGEVKTIEWQNSVDRLRIEGVMILPFGYVQGRRYPMIVHMHPGDLPWWPGFIGSWWGWGQLLASHGYVVLMPNYRGVNGYGWKLRETLGDWGGLALQDMLSAVDKLIREGIADSTRLGIGGWSNGGFMTEWTISHTTRFKAAVAEAAHSDFFSLYGTSRGEPPYFGVSPYVDRTEYDAHSPITYVKHVRTPTLLIHGGNDSGVPVTQSYEFHRALIDLGVETELVVYPHEGHGISQPKHRVEVQARMLDWFDRHLR
jgi:dipeptidyl aminopeptidase/acylaminoacyl peptidase